MSDRVTYVGSVTGTGSALDVTKLGFRPRVVKLINKDQPATLYWNKEMPNASGLKEVAAGTKTFPTTNGITPLANGFRIGALANINVADQVIYFEASD